MSPFEHFFESSPDGALSILDTTIPSEKYTPLDLSTTNEALQNLAIVNPNVCQKYIDEVLAKKKALVAYGGYLEKRNLYDKKAFLDPGNIPRNIHLGLDFWANIGTNVIAPLEGTVHSFKNNNTKGDYGPTIILNHKLKGFVFHTLYGHLSLESLKDLHVGKMFHAGETLATIGKPEINGNYAPHLHFQLIIDMQGLTGDYPGVCTANDVDHYSKNCPDPNLLLKIK